jgi:histidinol-phosphatase
VDDLRLALQLADLSDERTLTAFKAATTRPTVKADGSFVSQVDLNVEAALREAITQQRPDDVILGEELGKAEGYNDRVWTIDPIDHTNNFVRGIPVFATLISLIVAGQVEVGVVSSPAIRLRWWAQRGHGAHRSGRRDSLRVSTTRDLADAYISFAALHEWARRDKVDELVHLTRRVRFTYGSGGFLAHMLVAEGRLDASLDPWGHIWDLAPIQVIVEEAGGRFTDLVGMNHSAGGCAIVTNGLLHDSILNGLTRPPESRSEGQSRSTGIGR